MSVLLIWLQVAIMRLTGDRLFTNISDTGKAFTIILLTDIFLGYVVLLHNLNLLTSSKPQISDSLVFFLDPLETLQKWPTGTWWNLLLWMEATAFGSKCSKLNCGQFFFDGFRQNFSMTLAALECNLCFYLEQIGSVLLGQVSFRVGLGNSEWDSAGSLWVWS